MSSQAVFLRSPSDEQSLERVSIVIAVNPRLEHLRPPHLRTHFLSDSNLRSFCLPASRLYFCMKQLVMGLSHNNPYKFCLLPGILTSPSAGAQRKRLVDIRWQFFTNGTSGIPHLLVHCPSIERQILSITRTTPV
jgi:hypothetical protein